MMRMSSCHSERSEAATQRTKSARPGFQSLIICCAGELMVSQRCFASLNMTIGHAVRFFS